MPLYDLVAAPRSAVSALAASARPLATYAGFPCKPIDHVKLATLSVHLGLSTFDDAILALDPVAAGSEDGPWVSELPTPLLVSVAAMSLLQRWRVSSAWGATEEFAADRIGAAEARSFLAAFGTLWRHASVEGTHVFLWSSL